MNLITLLSNRFVIKIGSPLIAENGVVRTEWLNALAHTVHAVHAMGKDVCIVSSGAIALGMPGVPLKRLEDKQAAAAIGQINLAAAYTAAFGRHNIITSQVLMTRGDVHGLSTQFNARATFDELFKFRTIPIVNENDTVGTAEIRAGDNDVLAVEIANMIGADHVVQFMDDGATYTKEAQELALRIGMPVIIAPGKDTDAPYMLFSGRANYTVLGGEPAHVRAHRNLPMDMVF